MTFTPENITELHEDEILVFGSNMAGHHGGGAARTAHEKFGAKWGKAEGLSGQSYAFPTLNRDYSKRTIEELKASKDKLYICAMLNPETTFFVTKVGTGIAGFTLEEMRDVFEGEKPKNVVLPKEFS